MPERKRRGADRDERRRRIERGLSERMALSYDRLVSGYQGLYDAVIERTRRLLKPDDAVLEIGCGTGIVACGIAGAARAIEAVDISPRMIAVAMAKASSLGIGAISFSVADGYALNYEKRSFDAIIMANVLHIVKEPATLISEAKRLLKPGGLLITQTDCYSASAGGLGPKLRTFSYSLMKAMGLIYLNSYRKEDLDELLADSGLRIVESAVIQDVPLGYFLVGEKTSQEHGE
jgi:ubiquinone/menaquinone biosynthesis C-methylase UbiE